MALNQLRVGDQLLGEDGLWLTVEGVRDTGDFEPVFNFRVADFHTYFVGEEAWGWAVWAHNRACHLEEALDNVGLTEAFLGDQPWASLTRSTQGIVRFARESSATAPVAANRLAASLERRGIARNDPRLADLVEAALQGHYTPEQIAGASFMLRGATVHADHVARVAAGTTVSAGAIPTPAEFFNGVFPGSSQHHVLNGHINNAGKATGAHHTPSGIAAGTMTELGLLSAPNFHGAYEAGVAVRNPATGQYVVKISHGGVNSMFPASWSSGRVLSEIYAAYLTRGPHPGGGNNWLGVGTTGQQIQGFIQPNYPGHLGGGSAAPFGYVASAFPRI